MCQVHEFLLLKNSCFKTHNSTHFAICPFPLSSRPLPLSLVMSFSNFKFEFQIFCFYNFLFLLLYLFPRQNWAILLAPFKTIFEVYRLLHSSFVVIDFSPLHISPLWYHCRKSFLISYDSSCRKSNFRYFHGNNNNDYLEASLLLSCYSLSR